MLKPDEAYRLFFCDYPDVVNVKQMCAMLGGISEKTGYRLLHTEQIRFFTIGRSYRIPKINVIDYLAVTEEPCKE
jgi:excisionase family DNA binding protein